MRFIRRELSPANKKQYLLALGKRDLELLVGVSKLASKNMPILPDNKDDRQRLRSMTKSLSEALEMCIKDGDDGNTVPLSERDEFRKENPKQLDPMEKITRLEIIDHSQYNKASRELIFSDRSKQVESSIQDDGRTLKLFIKRRQQPEDLLAIFSNVIEKLNKYRGNL